MVLFTFFVVIYLMNLLIGLLNMAIDKENNRGSYLMHKAEVFIKAILIKFIYY